MKISSHIFFKYSVLIFLLSLNTNYAYAQNSDIDTSFLESLPDSVKNDVLKEISSKRQDEKDIYKRSSTMIQKNNIKDLDDEDLLDYEDYLKYVAEQKRLKEKKIERFGFNIFNSMQTSFMPINEPNIDGSYVLDYGDLIEIQIIGGTSDTFDVPIKRDGSISIEDMGRIFVAGLSLNKASDLIQGKVSDTYIGANANVSLIGLRDVQILVSGDAFNPGIYTVSGNSNALHVLSMAGGIGEKGSYREIEIIRDNEVVETIDLYDVFIHGKSNYGRRLRSGDSILIKPSKNLVKIEGGIERPFIYELKKGETLKTLLNYSNGLSDNADISYIKIDSYDSDGIKSSDIKYDEIDLFEPKSGDSVYIGEFKFIQVNISGSVKSPGTYTLAQDEQLSDLIERAGGYTATAYPFGGILNNQRTKELNEFANEQVYQNLIKFLASPQLQAMPGQSGMDYQSIGFMLQELKKSPVSGRVMAEFDLDEIRYSSIKDTTLEDGDEVIIPSLTQQVYVYGEVNSPGTLRYRPGMNFEYYLSNKGGLNNFANEEQLFVVYPNGQTYALETNTLFGFSPLSDDVLIYPGSIIYVPRNISISNTQTAAIWAPLVSSLAVTLTSLSVLND